MQNLVADELNIRVDLGSPGLVRLIMSGKSSSREPGKVLIPFFADALQHAADKGASIEVHFEELNHFNSSTIAAVIQFINSSQERHIALALHYDPTLKWQALSFEALMRAIRPFESFSTSKVHFVEVAKK